MVWMMCSVCSLAVLNEFGMNMEAYKIWKDAKVELNYAPRMVYKAGEQLKMDVSIHSVLHRMLVPLTSTEGVQRSQWKPDCSLSMSAKDIV